MSEFFSNTESQNAYINVEKSEIIRHLEKYKNIESSLKQKNYKLQSKINTLEAIIAEMKQGNLGIKIEEVKVQEYLFEKSSEKSTKEEIAASQNDDLRIPGGSDNNNGEVKAKRVLLPSLRYPNIEVRKIHLIPEKPLCPCCNHLMVDSGLTEETERLSVISKQYAIDRQIKHKFRCNECHGGMIAPTPPPCITPGGAYSDSFIIDVAISKFYDLVPISRYIKIAERLDIQGLPSQSLIECTHQLSHFLRSVYRLIRKEVISSRVIHADETPHFMLEGEDKGMCYLWGFTTKIAAYFDIQNTRSGSVVSELLKESLCEYLASDVFSGYGKAVRDTNEYRVLKGITPMKNVYCNAHARRNFKKSEGAFKAASEYYLSRYRSIYYLESQLTNLLEKDPDLPPERILETRGKMRVFYEEMKANAEIQQLQYLDSSSIAKAMKYFLSNYDNLTSFVTNVELPIDNNPAERILRNPVIGRKTWFGTHSKLGAETTAVLFSIMESCKLNKVNPNQYLQAVVSAIHESKAAFTPRGFALSLKNLQ